MAFCKNCGTQLGDGIKFCVKCGAKQDEAPAQGAAPQAQYQAPQAQYQAPQAQYAPQPQFTAPKVSDWDGGVLETIAASIVASLIMTFTCGIGAPWGICYLYKFIINHVVVDGRRLRFDGTGGQLFGKWIVWFLLTIVTCGIYSFWLTPRLYQWIASHTHFE